MKTRCKDWFDLESGKPLYSYQVFVHGRWHFAHRNGQPQFFDTEEARDAARKVASGMHLPKRSNGE